MNRSVFLECNKISNLNSGLGQFSLRLIAELKRQNNFCDFSYFTGKKGVQYFDVTDEVIQKKFYHDFFPPNSKKFDTWHCFHQGSKYMPTSSQTKLVYTIHDLNFLEKYKENYKRDIFLKTLQKHVNRASVITVISNFTENIVRENLEVSVPIHVIHNGNCLDLTLTPESDSQVTMPFLFTIGIISQKKNFHTLIPLLVKNKDLCLVIAGNKNSRYAKLLIELARQMQVENRLILPGMVSDERKLWYYQHCKAFVFPSLLEGFGLPVVEAMSLGKPCFISNLTSLPEVGGSQAYYFQSFDPESMQEVYLQGMQDFERHPDKSQKIIAQANRFTWENAAKKYLELY